jgi:hypothetical protein
MELRGLQISWQEDDWISGRDTQQMAGAALCEINVSAKHGRLQEPPPALRGVPCTSPLSPTQPTPEIVANYTRKAFKVAAG